MHNRKVRHLSTPVTVPNQDGAKMSIQVPRGEEDLWWERDAAVVTLCAKV